MSTISPAPKPQTTMVLGYFNKNGFPVNISSDHLGLKMQVAEKSYVMDRQGRYINDPRLDAYTQQGGLFVKEFSKAPVPLVLLAGTPVMGASPATSVATSVPVAGTILQPGATLKMPDTTRPTGQPAAGSSSIRTMSVAHAVKAGVIPNPDRRDRMSRAPDEDQTGAAAYRAPQMDRVMPIPKIAVPASVQEDLRRSSTLDASDLTALDADDTVQTATSGAAPAAPLALKPAPIAVAPADAPITVTAVATAAAPAPVAPAAVAPAAPSAPRPSVEWNGKLFTTAGNLKKAMLKFYSGDQSQATEAFAEFKGRFAPTSQKA